MAPTPIEPVQYVIVLYTIDDPDPYIIGPFPNKEEADEYAKEDEQSILMRVVPLQTPVSY